MKIIGKYLALYVLSALPAGVALADGDIELVEQMGKLQYFAHKSNLAIEHKNKPLLKFYAHELEEYLEKSARIKSYDGYPVGKLTEAMIMPKFESFESAVKADNWDQISNSFDDVINACNACHEATEHGFINIQRVSTNPYMQSFKATKLENK